MITMTNILNTTRKGCNHLVIVADWLSDFGDKSLYAFLFKRADLKKVEDNFDVYFSETPESSVWAGMRLTSRGKKALRDLVPNRYLCEVDAVRLAEYQGTANQAGNACEVYMVTDYNGEILPAQDDLNCRDIKIKVGKSWIICQVKKMDTSVTANVHW